MQGPNPQTFEATVEKAGSKAFVQLSFDPNSAWGQKQRHHIHGTVNQHRLRAQLQEQQTGYVISLGAAFRRDTGINVGDPVTITIEPEGPQLYNMAKDIVDALVPEPDAVDFFNALATHYRKNYVRWVEEAKQTETRSRRIEEMVSLLKQGKQKK